MNHLGIGISQPSTGPWPLHVRPRSLAVLAEILLLRQQNEHDASSSAMTSVMTSRRDSEMVVMNIWTRLITTLVDVALTSEITKANAAELDDVNVEHIQLFIFLFHNTLTLMQKKSMLLQLCQSIVSVTQSLDGRLNAILPLSLTRLLLIVDYMLHYFYDMPQDLVEQVSSICQLIFYCVIAFLVPYFES